APQRFVVPAPNAAPGSGPGGAAAAPGPAAPANAPAGAPLGLPRNAPAAAPAKPPKPPKPRAEKGNGKLRRFLPHRPKLRRIIFLLPILVPLLIILLIAGGLFYANAKFNELHRVPVGDVLDAEQGGTNILLVGSDSRDLQGLPAEGGAAPTGQRSDTIMVLRLDGTGAHTLSIPRDLIVTIATTGKRDRINSAYNPDLGGGPVRLIQTVKDALRIPINRYLEVDFATFAGVVDAVGGIDIDFPNPAFDDNTGLDVTTAGTAHLKGEEALAYVRSRHYTEIINGKKVEDPTSDLGRIKRQQAFLTAVFGEVGSTKSPFTLLKVGGEMTKGLRVDDQLGFLDALRLGWDLKGLHPDAVELPVASNADNATLHLRDDADTALALFR
ncbi:MAG: LCP family protein, partial [Acidimicrobiales bacterium]